MWPFTERKNKRRDVFELTELLLVKRLEAEAVLEDKKATSMLAAMERELKFKEKELAFHEARREAARERAKAQRTRAILEGHQTNRFGRHGGDIKKADCRCCANPSDLALTAEEIIFCRSNHPQRGMTYES